MTTGYPARSFGRRNAPAKEVARPIRPARVGRFVPDPISRATVADTAPDTWHSEPEADRPDAATWRLRTNGAGAAAVLCGMLIIPMMEGRWPPWAGFALFGALFTCVALAWHFHYKTQEHEKLELAAELHALNSGTAVRPRAPAADPSSFAAWRHKQDGFGLAFASGVGTVGAAVKFLDVGSLSFGTGKPVNVLPVIAVACLLVLPFIVRLILWLFAHTQRYRSPRGLAFVAVGVALTSIAWVPLLLLTPLCGTDALVFALSMAVAGGVAGLHFWWKENLVVR